MSSIIKISILFTTLIFRSFTSCAQQVNLESANAYWKITDQLRAGDSLSTADWNNFLNLEGNKIYIENQAFSKKFLENYRKTLQFVYNPVNELKVKEMMNDKFNNWLAYKINQYKDHEYELKAYASSLQDSGYLDSIYAKSWGWLPEALRNKSSDLKMYYIGIDNDAIAQNNTLVFTLWSSYIQDKLKFGILGGHELHHFLRQPISFKVLPSEEGAFYVLQTVLNEGSADMIDKKYSFDQTKGIPVEYQFEEFLLQRSADIIAQIDSTFQLVAHSGGEKFTTVNQYRKLMNYSSGHNPGYFMADIIVRNGYKKEMIRNVQNPFVFIRLYNKAARKDKEHPPVFSKAAMNYCKNLESKYWKKQAKKSS